MEKDAKYLVNTLINRKTPRAFDNRTGGCVYRHSIHGGCAIGCNLPEELAVRFDKLGGGNVIGVSNDLLKPILPEWMKAIDNKILSELQNIHDSPGNWINEETAKTAEDGLVWNNAGRYCINLLIEKYSIDVPPLKYLR